MTISTENTKTPPKPEEKPATGYVDKKPEEKPEEKPPEVNEFGYDTLKVEKTPEEKKVEEEKIAAEKKIEEDKKKVETPATGYVEKTPEEKIAAEKLEAEKKVTEVSKEDIDKALGDFPDKEGMSKFAVEQKITKEQLEAYVALRKSQDATAIQEYENTVKETRTTWHTELKNDADFGGENFDKNVDRVEKVLEKYLPNTKKILTERGSMLPPYIMRDLLSLSQTLNPTTDLVTGDPSKPVEKEDGNFLEVMYK